MEPGRGRIKVGCRVALVPEDVDTWQNCNGINLLRGSYEGATEAERVRCSSGLQLETLNTNVRDVAISLQMPVDTIFVERSDISNRIFGNLLLEDNLMDLISSGVYKTHADAVHQMMKLMLTQNVTCTYIHIQANPDTCTERACSRTKDNNIPKELNRKLAVAHEKTFVSTNPMLHGNVVEVRSDDCSIDELTERVLKIAFPHLPKGTSGSSSPTNTVTPATALQKHIFFLEAVIGAGTFDF